MPRSLREVLFPSYVPQPKINPGLVWFDGSDYALTVQEFRQLYLVESAWRIPELFPNRCSLCRKYSHGRFLTFRQRLWPGNINQPDRVHLCHKCSAKLGY
jgi:hypothetical protein